VLEHATLYRREITRFSEIAHQGPEARRLETMRQMTVTDKFEGTHLGGIGEHSSMLSYHRVPTIGEQRKRECGEKSESQSCEYISYQV
jgi:hypothetical protein